MTIVHFISVLGELIENYRTLCKSRAAIEVFKSDLDMKKHKLCHTRIKLGRVENKNKIYLFITSYPAFSFSLDIFISFEGGAPSLINRGDLIET